MDASSTPRRTGRIAAAMIGTVAVGLSALAAVPASAAVAPPAPTRSVVSAGNPIVADGSTYTADAAPLVGADGRFYLYTGHDVSGVDVAGFDMHDYTVLATDDVASGKWDVYEKNLVPADVFSWATGDNAYAGVTIQGTDGKYYWYVPVQTKDATQFNRMAIGVAVADSPVGPWTDALGEPLLDWNDVFGASTNGQEVIDPHVFRDDDGTVYLYWGSWGVARAVKLAASMTATSGAITTLSGLDSLYEAPWVVKRNGIYYMVYDWKSGGSECTPSNYQACVAYATATSPLGPWTYRGIILGGTSATTVHPSLVQFKDQWYLTYHTKDAVGGGHFRRSVAIDTVEWDGATIKPVVQTKANDPLRSPNVNLALDATVSASFTEQPPMRTKAVNDGFRATTALLPPDQWGNFRGKTSDVSSDWLQYQWATPVRTGSVGIQFGEDGNWIRTPDSWRLEYLDANGDWKPVTGATYPTTVNTWLTVSFDPITTTALRATFTGRAEGAAYHSVAVSEWEVYARESSAQSPVGVTTAPGTAPALPAAIRIDTDGQQLWAPVRWANVDPAAYATEGTTFTVTGRALGYAEAPVEASVVVTSDPPPPAPADTTAPTVTLSGAGSSGSDGWYSSNVTLRAAADDAGSYLNDVSVRVGAGSWTEGKASRYVEATVTATGSTTVTAKATDAAGNTSATVSRTVKIDKDKPTATAKLDAATRAVTVTGTDAASGVAAIEYRFDGAGAWRRVPASGSVAAPDDLPHLLSYRVSDKAGNVTAGTVTVPFKEGAVLTGNVAQYATPFASFTSGWESVAGLSDGTGELLGTDEGALGANWGTWPEVGEQTATLSWSFAVRVGSVGVWWYRNVPDAQNEGLIPPRSWVLQYLDQDGSTWRAVTPDAGQAYGRSGTGFDTLSFTPVTTKGLRIVAQSWGQAATNGSTGIREWQAIAAVSDGTAPSVATQVSPAASASGWHTAAVSVTAAATDDTDSTPVLQSSVDGAEWSAYSGPVAVTADGAHTVRFRATDKAGNTSAPVTVDVKVDRIAPKTDAIVTPASGSVTTPGSVSARFEATDSTSSVAATQVSTDGGATWENLSTVSYSTVGTHVVQYRSVDVAGNVEAAKSVTLTVVEPSASARVTITSADEPSADGWYQQSVLVRLAATVSGQKVQYRVNGGTWRMASGAITVSANGTTTIDHRLLVSNAVAAGTEAQTVVKIDKLVPIVSSERSPASGTGSPRNPIAVTFVGADTLSGVDRVQYRLNSGDWTTAPAEPVTFDTVGDYVVAYRAVDRAGNVSATKSVTVSIVADTAITVKPSATKVKPGSPVTLTLAGFGRWDQVALTVGGVAVGSVMTDQNGTAKVTVRVPADALAGQAAIVATGTAPAVAATTTIAVRR